MTKTVGEGAGMLWVITYGQRGREHNYNSDEERKLVHSSRHTAITVYILHCSPAIHDTIQLYLNFVRT